jgi:ATP-dependent helicase/nuclease subunit A
MMAKPLDRIPDQEKQDRLLATDPALHAWVAANAGSGKTTILRNRVIRLLLSGASPDRILCLTYTKAAAAEMQNRIFEELAKWVGLDDTALDREIGTILDDKGRPAGFSAHQLAMARTLFAHAIETPGGLKIQTIHAFAERILRLFPLESGVPLNFEILDDATTSSLVEDARQMILGRAIRMPGSPLATAFHELVDASGLGTFTETLDKALTLLGGLAIKGIRLPDAETRMRLMRQRLGLGRGLTRAMVDADWQATLPTPGTLAGWVAELKRFPPGSVFRNSFIATLERAIESHVGPDIGWISPVIDGMVTLEGRLSGNLLSAKQQQQAPDLVAELQALLEGHAQWKARHGAFDVLERSLALMTFAEAVHHAFEARKQARNALDFNDLIAALRRLVRAGHAGWIMMKLDAAIDHILVDEAQDTTPDMWDILKALTEEFFAGQSQVVRPRSLFVVGDEKQSIFSFQGANPADFEAARQHFGEKAGKPHRILDPVPLNHSFRTSPDLLDVVDRIFSDVHAREGVALSGKAIKHSAAWPNFPGETVLWPLIRPPAADQTPTGPFQPPAQALAEAVASQIRTWLDTGARHLRDGKLIQPGDILILVQTRDGFFEAMLKALKRRGLPVAGADRLKLQDHIAVQDLLVVAEAVLSPNHDLALATALRSPLFALDDETLERVARCREGSLQAALAREPAAAAQAARLAALIHAAKILGPYAFFARLLAEPVPGPSGLTGRQALQQRLGSDIHDPIDAFLMEAQGFESRETSALLLFLLDQRRRSTEIKRDMDQSGDQIRVMTVHGSKGLEGRIVFLCDTTRPPKGIKRNEPVLAFEEDLPLLAWLGSRTDVPVGLQPDFDRLNRLQREESRRLFYVAMTRASDRLIIGGRLFRPPAKDELAAGAEHLLKDPAKATWYQLARIGLSTHPGASRMPDPDAVARGLDGLNREIITIAASTPAADPAAIPSVREPADMIRTRPDWLDRHPPAEGPRPRRLVPSQLAGPEVSGPREDGQAAARQRGILVHRLVELLAPQPPAKRQEAAARWLSQVAPKLSEPDIASLLAPILTLLAAPHLARWFGSDSRAEVALAGSVTLVDGTPSLVEARFDRLVIAPDWIGLLDIKTGLRGEAVSEGILKQMALYRRLIATLYPGRQIDCALLWTRDIMLEPLPETLLDAAFTRIEPPRTVSMRIA